MEGYYSISREHDAIIDFLPGYTVKLYLYLIRRAAFKANSLVQIGEVLETQEHLAKVNRLSRQNIRTSLKNLKNFGLVTVKSFQNQHTICIVNPRRFEPASPETNQKLTRKSPETNQKLTLLEEGISNKAINNNTYAQSEFARVWDRYPRKLGRKAALRHFTASVHNQAELDQINAAMNNYLAHLRKEGTDLQYTQHGSTWFNDWQCWISPPAAIQHARPSQPQEIPSWKLIPPESELVPPSEISELLKSLSAGRNL